MVAYFKVKSLFYVTYTRICWTVIKVMFEIDAKSR
jgi:hypothetical protein